MKVFAKGQKLVLTKPLSIRTSYSIGTIPVGETIEIQQVNESNNQVLVDNVWMHYSRIRNATEVGESNGA